MNFSQILNELMKNNGINKATLAKQLNVSPSTITNWLNGGRPSIGHMRKTAAFFHVSTDYLLSGRVSSGQPQAQNSCEKLEVMLVQSFRKVSFGGKIALLKFAESLTHCKHNYNVLDISSDKEQFAFAEGGICKNSEPTEGDK